MQATMAGAVRRCWVQGYACGIRVTSLPQLSTTKASTGCTLLEYIVERLAEQHSPVSCQQRQRVLGSGCQTEHELSVCAYIVQVISLPAELPHLKEAAKAPPLSSVTAELQTLRADLQATQGRLATLLAPASIGDAERGADFIARMEPHLAAAAAKVAHLETQLRMATDAYEATCK